MIRIALCDDEDGQRALTEGMIARYLDRRPALCAKVSVYASALALINSVEERGGFDVYVLDIIMPRMSGIKAGMELRRLGDSGAILYLTTSPDYAVDSYLTNAVNYLLKPVEDERFFAAMDMAVQSFERKREKCVVVRTRDADMRLSLDDILYVELSGRAIRYHLRDAQAVTSRTVAISFREAISDMLADKRFALCGASFAANLHYARAVGKNELTLTDGRTVPLSRAMAGDVKRRWVDYWLEDGV